MIQEKHKTVIIDEVQRNPELLDLVHQMSVRSDRQFILTGSSARKLKRGQANLLAGRAFN
jgi:predicted AAA+ superfamily ATPase